MCVKAREHSNVEQFLDGDQPCTHAVVHVVVVVRDGVREIGELRLEAGLRSIEEALAHIAPSSRAFCAEQCFSTPSRHSNVRLRPEKSA